MEGEREDTGGSLEEEEKGEGTLHVQNLPTDRPLLLLLPLFHPFPLPPSPVGTSLPPLLFSPLPLLFLVPPFSPNSSFLLSRMELARRLQAKGEKKKWRRPWQPGTFFLREKRGREGGRGWLFAHSTLSWSMEEGAVKTPASCFFISFLVLHRKEKRKRGKKRVSSIRANPDSLLSSVVLGPF